MPQNIDSTIHLGVRGYSTHEVKKLVQISIAFQEAKIGQEAGPAVVVKVNH